MSSPFPYWRIASFYGFYFASLGALIPYLSLYLQHLEFSPQQIGEVMAVIMATRIVAPNLWSWIADHTGQGMLIVRITSLLALISFAGIFMAQDYGWLMLVMSTFSFFWNASLPQFEANTLSHLGADTHRYSQIRLWGSVGFIITVWGMGALFEHYSVTWLPPIVLSLFAGIWLTSLLVPARHSEHHAHHHNSLWKVLKQPSVIALLIVCFLMQASHGPYYTFYTIYLESYGYQRGFIGSLWALGVIAEVGIFIVMHRILWRFCLEHLLIISLLLAALRWLIIGAWADSLILLLLAQTLHAASFALYHAVSIQLIHHYFVGKYQGRGQALYSSLSFGAGGALGSLLSGYVWDMNPHFSFFAAALACLFGAWISWRWIRH